MPNRNAFIRFNPSAKTMAHRYYIPLPFCVRYRFHRDHPDHVFGAWTFVAVCTSAFIFTSISLQWNLYENNVDQIGYPFRSLRHNKKREGRKRRRNSTRLLPVIKCCHFNTSTPIRQTTSDDNGQRRFIYVMGRPMAERALFPRVLAIRSTMARAYITRLCLEMLLIKWTGLCRQLLGRVHFTGIKYDVTETRQWASSYSAQHTINGTILITS